MKCKGREKILRHAKSALFRAGDGKVRIPIQSSCCKTLLATFERESQNLSFRR